MAEATDAQIIAEHTRLGFPGLDKFYVHIRRWAPTQQLEVPTKARVREIIAKRSTPQVFAQPKSSKGQDRGETSERAQCWQPWSARYRFDSRP